MSVKAKVLATSDLSPVQREQMFSVFSKYYENVSPQTFSKDLDEKDDVIVLFSKGRIVGFSTLLARELDVQGRKVLGIYSGDTILEREFWGSSALGRKFLWYLWGKKLARPTMSVYWFLISKGYKTYLLMANNFSNHYPNYAEATPGFEQELMHRFYGERFGEKYRPDSGLILFPETSCRLKEFVAPITQEMRRKYPRIAFFEQKNPGWAQGQELACIAEMTLAMPVTYSLKKLMKKSPGARKPKRAPAIVHRPLAPHKPAIGSSQKVS